MESEQTRQLNFVEAPTDGKGFAVVLTAATVGSIDLTTIDNQTKDLSDATKTKTGAADCYVTIVVDGTVPIYITGSTAQVAALTNAVVGNGTTGIGFPLYPSPATGPGALPAGGYRFRFRKGVNHVLSYYSTGTPTLRIFKSSPYAG